MITLASTILSGRNCRRGRRHAQFIGWREIQMQPRDARPCLFHAADAMLETRPGFAPPLANAEAGTNAGRIFPAAKTLVFVRPPTARGSGQSCFGLMPAPKMPPTQRLGSTSTTVQPSCFAATAATMPAGVAP